MKTIIMALLMILFQQKEIIRISMTKANGHDSVKMEYPEFSDYRGFLKLQKGSYRFYITTDATCTITLVNSKTHDVSPEEVQEFNTLLERYAVEFYQDNVRVLECGKYSGRQFPITVLIP